MTSYTEWTRSVRHECNVWSLKLEHLSHENTKLKNELSAMLAKRHITSGVLQLAEQFNSSFLQGDDMIGVLRREIGLFQSEVEEAGYLTEGALWTLNIRVCQFAKELKLLEALSLLLKNQFHDFLDSL